MLCNFKLSWPHLVLPLLYCHCHGWTRSKCFNGVNCKGKQVSEGCLRCCRQLWQCSRGSICERKTLRSFLQAWSQVNSGRTAHKVTSFSTQTQKESCIFRKFSCSIFKLNKKVKSWFKHPAKEWVLDHTPKWLYINCSYHYCDMTLSLIDH